LDRVAELLRAARARGGGRLLRARRQERRRLRDLGRGLLLALLVGALDARAEVDDREPDRDPVAEREDLGLDERLAVERRPVAGLQVLDDEALVGLVNPAMLARGEGV